MSIGNPTPAPKGRKWLLAGILCVGTLLYVIAVIWIGIGSIQHVSAINAAAKAAEAEQTTDMEAPTTQEGDEQAAEPAPIDEDALAPQPYPISDFITQALLVIGGALATHLGAFLGISITDPTRNFLLGKNTFNAIVGALFTNPEGVAGMLAATYFLTLVLAIVLWALTGFSAYAGKPLQDLAYSFLGIFAGAMAALSTGS